MQDITPSVHSLCILRTFSTYLLFIPVRSPVSSRGLPAGRAALQLPPGLCEGPGDSAGVPGAEQQARCVWIVRSLRFIHIFDGPAPENRPQIGQFVYGHVDPGKRYTAFHENLCIVLRICTGHTQNSLFVRSYPSARRRFCV